MNIKMDSGNDESKELQFIPNGDQMQSPWMERSWVLQRVACVGQKR